MLKENQIFFYKDQKTYRTHPGDTFKGEPSVDLMNCTAEVATDYTKKKYVFRLRYVVLSSKMFTPNPSPDLQTVDSTCSKQPTRSRWSFG